MYKRSFVARFAVLPASLALLAAGGCGHDDAKGQQAQAALGGGMPATPVAVMHAAQRDIATYSMLDGQIAPSLSSSLGLPQAGTIENVYAQEGDRVEKGQVLAQIDDRTLRAQLAQNEAVVAQADANLKSSNLTVPINNAAVGSTLISAREQLEASRNALKTARAALHSAEVLDRGNGKLLGQGYLAQTTYEQTHSNYISAQQAVGSAQATVLQNEAALRSAQQNTGKVGVQQETVAANRAAASQARAQVRLLATQVDQTTLRAPFNGIVTSRLLDPGAYAGPNQPIYQVAALDTVYVNFGVPDDQLRYAHVGTPVSFTVGQQNRTLRGTIASLNTVPANGTLQYRARIVQSNPDNSLRGGMLVTVALQREKASGAIVVPRTAVGRGMDGKTNVFVVDGGKAKALPVTIGLENDMLAQVTSGNVHPGDAVVSTRPDTLADGAAVKIASTSELPASSAEPPRRVSSVGSNSQGEVRQ